MSLQITLDPAQLSQLAEMIVAKSQGAARREPYSIADAAKVLGVCAATIRRRVQAGIIPCVPNVGKRLIPSAVIEQMLTGNA